MVRDRGVRRCVSGHIRGPGRKGVTEMAPDSVRPRHARHHLGKTFYMAVRGGE